MGLLNPMFGEVVSQRDVLQADITAVLDISIAPAGVPVRIAL